MIVIDSGINNRNDHAFAFELVILPDFLNVRHFICGRIGRIINTNRFDRSNAFQILNLLQIGNFDVDRKTVDQISERALDVASRNFFNLLANVGLCSFDLVDCFFDLFDRFRRTGWFCRMINGHIGIKRHDHANLGIFVRPARLSFCFLLLLDCFKKFLLVDLGLLLVFFLQILGQDLLGLR